MLLGHFEAQILHAVLQNIDRAYGVTIADTLRQWKGREPAMGAVYSTLDRLQHKGYLRSTWSQPKPERGGRAKRMFEVTGLGQQVLREYTEQFNRVSAGWQPALGRG